MSVLPACVYVSHVQAWCPWIPEEGSEPPDPGVTEGCEPWCESWVLKLAFCINNWALSLTSLPFISFDLFFFSNIFLEKMKGEKSGFLAFLLNYAINIAPAMLDTPSVFSQPHNNPRARLILSLYS